MVHTSDILKHEQDIIIMQIDSVKIKKHQPLLPSLLESISFSIRNEATITIFCSIEQDSATVFVAVLSKVNNS